MSKKTKTPILEVCVDSLTSAQNAIDAGANRLEVCSALELGGLTPSAGLLHQIREITNLPLHILIRPRSGDFTYSSNEFKTILQDIEYFKSEQVQGIVCGALHSNSNINIEKTVELIEAIKPLSFTFHRAFDYVPNISIALNTLIKLGVNRVLTSGQKQTALQGIKNISNLVKQADNKIIIMPGSGINPNNIGKILETGAKEFHMSGNVTHKGVLYTNNIRTGNNEDNFGKIQISNKNKIENTLTILKQWDQKNTLSKG